MFSSAVRTLGSPDDLQYAFASELVGSVVNAGLDATRPAPGPTFSGTVFDDDGHLMPGMVDANAPATEQYRQLQAALATQCLPSDLAQSLALNSVVAAGADARTVRGYFVPDETHDVALKEVLPERAALGAVEPAPPDAEVEPDPVRVGESGQVIQLPTVTVTVTGRRITLPDDLAERLGGPLGDLYQQGKDIAAQGLDLAAEGLSLLDIPALQDFQQRTRDYLNAQAEAGGLSEAEVIMFGSLYALNEALNGQLRPNATYLLDNGHAYVTDGAGRVLRAEGVLDVSRADRNTWQQAAAGHAGREGCDGGHLIATLFGGASEWINLVPQLSTINRGEFREMERQRAQAVLDKKTVRVEVSPIDTNDSRVPTLIDVVCWMDGKPTSRQFGN